MTRRELIKHLLWYMKEHRCCPNAELEAELEAELQETDL